MGPPGTPGGLRTATDLSHALGGMDDSVSGGDIDPLSPQPAGLPYWTLELAFPLHASPPGAAQPHGGLLDGPGQCEACHSDELDMETFDPNHGARYWWADFARTQHPVLTVGPKPELTGAKFFQLGSFYRSTLAETDFSENNTLYGRDTQESPKTAAMCEELAKKWPSLLGPGASGCSWEW